MTHNEELKNLYEQVCHLYAQKFAEKHDLKFNGWIGGSIGEVAEMSDLYFDLRDIRTDIDNDVPAGTIIRWYDQWCEAEKSYMNYRTWLKWLKTEDQK